MATIVFFHAHPDDEAIATGGTMARLSDEGHRVILVTATRGELGELPADGLAEGETLSDRRSVELERASAILGVARQEYLGFGDSGMAGEATNHASGAFAAVDVEEAAAALISLLKEEGADVLVTYDEHGGYGHPDHIQVHRVGVAAAAGAGTPVVYLATMNRDMVASFSALAAEYDFPMDPSGPPDAETIGEPEARLTTDIDVMPWLDRKREAMRVHASQISEDSFFLGMPPGLFAAVWGREFYVRVRPGVEPGGMGPFESELLLAPAVVSQ